MNKEKIFTCKDLSEGRVACINDGTIDELRKVLNFCFPNDKFETFGSNSYYYLMNKIGDWDSSEKTDFPTQSVKVFLKEIEEQEKPKEIKVGDYIRGFHFNNFDYVPIMDNYIGVIGKVIQFDKEAVEIKFADGKSYIYPKEEALLYLANEDIEEYEKALDQLKIDKTIEEMILKGKQKLYSVFLNKGNESIVYTDLTDLQVNEKKNHFSGHFSIVIEQAQDKGIKIDLKY